MKAANPDKRRDYQREAGVELRDNAGRRLRKCHWEQWNKIKTRQANLVRLGIPDEEAWQYANTRKGSWRIAKSPILNRTLTNAYFTKLGLVGLSVVYCRS